MEPIPETTVRGTAMEVTGYSSWLLCFIKHQALIMPLKGFSFIRIPHGHNCVPRKANSWMPRTPRTNHPFSFVYDYCPGYLIPSILPPRLHFSRRIPPGSSLDVVLLHVFSFFLHFCFAAIVTVPSVYVHHTNPDLV